MNDEERRIISDFVARIAGAQPAPAQASPWGGSVPSTQQRPPLPPVDRDADAMIAQLFQQYPEARYRITQTAFVQEAAIVEMQNRIRQLEWEVENARSQAQAAQQQPRGMFGGMFGGGSRPAPAPMTPPPQPQYPPGYNPQVLQPQRGGMGFFGTALAGAAGVAGGMILGNALMNAFSGHHGAQAATSPFAPEAGTQAAAASPWTDPGAAAADQGWGGGDKFANGGDKFTDQGGGGWGGDAPANQASWGGDQGGDAGGGGDWGGSSGGDDYSSSDDT